MHAQGTRWSMVGGPVEGAGFGLTARSGDVWVVGAVTTGDKGESSRAVAGRWQGTGWDRGSGASNVPYPEGVVDPTTYSALYGVAALSPQEVWAVGTYSNTATTGLGTGSERLWKTLIMRW